VPELGAIFAGEKEQKCSFSCINNIAPNLRVVMKNPNRFYTYAFLREDGTPYYIGKGSGYRVKDRKRGDIKSPRDKSRIIFLKQDLTEEEAFKHEIYMISVFGRKDLETGILRNKTDGGEGTSNVIRNDEWRKKQQESQKIRFENPEQRKKLSESIKKSWNNPKVREKLISSFKNKKLSEQHKQNLKESMERFYKDNPDYKTQKSEYQSKFLKGKKWWNNGSIEKIDFECPGDEWKRGRIKWKKHS